jgi:hypothetical protein
MSCIPSTASAPVAAIKWPQGDDILLTAPRRRSRAGGNPAAVTKLLLATVLLTVTTIAPPIHAEELGRLFLTPEQRLELERRRNGLVPPPPVVVEAPTVVEPAVVQGELPPPVQELGASQILPEAPPPEVPPITVNGVVIRSNGQGTAWVNGQNTSEGDFSADNIRVGRPQGKMVPIQTPENLPNVRLMPGQTYDPSTNTIVDVAPATQ